MHRNKLDQIVDDYYEDAEIIDTNPETTETYKEEEEDGYETKEGSLRFVRRW